MSTWKKITLRDFAALGPEMDLFDVDNNYEVADMETSAHYKVSENGQTAYLGGDEWGSLEQLFDREIAAIELFNGKLIITVS